MYNNKITAILFAVSLVAVAATGLAPSAAAEDTDCITSEIDMFDLVIDPMIGGEEISDAIDEAGDECGAAIDQATETTNSLLPGEPVPGCEDPSIPCEYVNVSFSFGCPDCEQVGETIDMVRVDPTFERTPEITFAHCEFFANQYFAPMIDGETLTTGDNPCPLGEHIGPHPFMPTIDSEDVQGPDPDQAPIPVEIGNCEVSVTLQVLATGPNEAPEEPFDSFGCALPSSV